MFRTADAAGIDKIYLTGYTPAPIDRFGRNAKIWQSPPWRGGICGLGGEEKYISIACKLKREKFFIIGVEQDKILSITKNQNKNKNVFIVGAEVTGVPKIFWKNAMLSPKSDAWPKRIAECFSGLRNCFV